MRLRARVDENQKRLVDYARKRGLYVLHLHGVGHGCPDLLVSTTLELWLVEVKNPEQEGRKSEFTEAQQRFYDEWKGKPVLVWRSEEDVDKLVSGNHTLLQQLMSTLYTDRPLT